MHLSLKRRRVWSLLFSIISFSLLISGQSPTRISGTVSDPAGTPIAAATVSLINARQTVRQSTQTNGQGEFQLTGISPGTYELLVTASPANYGFAAKRVPVMVTAAGVVPLRITLGVAELTAEVTVTAEIGTVQSLDQTSQQVNVIEESRLGQRAKSVTAQIAQE